MTVALTSPALSIDRITFQANLEESVAIFEPDGPAVCASIFLIAKPTSNRMETKDHVHEHHRSRWRQPDN
jgi:hypothetical protein